MCTGAAAERGTVNVEISQQTIYVDAPKHETVQEWQARVNARGLGLNSVRQLDGEERH